VASAISCTVFSNNVTITGLFGLNQDAELNWLPFYFILSTLGKNPSNLGDVGEFRA